MRKPPPWRTFLLALLIILSVNSTALSVLVELRDGRTYHGKIVADTGDKIGLMTDTGETIVIERSKIRAIASYGNHKEYATAKLEESHIPFDPEEFIRRVQRGDRNAVSLLLSAGMSPNTMDQNGAPALILAVQSGNLEIVRVLVHRAPWTNASGDYSLETVNINAKDKEGDSALMWAVKDDRADIVKFLLKEGADVNAGNTRGETPLMLAARNGQIDMVKLLLKEGADVNAKSIDGETASTLAAKEGQSQVLNVLSKSSPNAAAYAQQEERVKTQQEQSPLSVHIPLSWMDARKDELITEKFDVTIMTPALALGGYTLTEVDSKARTSTKWIDFMRQVPPQTISATAIIDKTSSFNCISERLKKQLERQIGITFSEASFFNLAVSIGQHQVEDVTLIFHGDRYGPIDSIAYMDFHKERPSLILLKPFIQDRFVTCWDYYIERGKSTKLDAILNVEGLCDHLNTCRPDPSIDIRFGKDVFNKIPHRLDEEQHTLTLW